MATRLAINGFDRIGRAISAAIERDADLEVVTVHDVADADGLARLLRDRRALTTVIGATRVEVAAWYDNEWGYSNRLVELAERVLIRAPAAVSTSCRQRSQP